MVTTTVEKYDLKILNMEARWLLPPLVAALLLRGVLQQAAPKLTPPPSPPPSSDPLAFLWPPRVATSLSLCFEDADGQRRLPRLLVSVPGFNYSSDGARIVQVDDSEPLVLDTSAASARGEQLTLELQGLVGGQHQVRAWFERASGERLLATSMAFSLQGSAEGARPLPAHPTNAVDAPPTPPVTPSSPSLPSAPLPSPLPPSSPSSPSSSTSASSVYTPPPPRLERQPWPLPNTPSPAPSSSVLPSRTPSFPA